MPILVVHRDHEGLCWLDVCHNGLLMTDYEMHFHVKIYDCWKLSNQMLGGAGNSNWENYSDNLHVATAMTIKVHNRWTGNWIMMDCCNLLHTPWTCLSQVLTCQFESSSSLWTAYPWLSWTVALSLFWTVALWLLWTVALWLSWTVAVWLLT